MQYGALRADDSVVRASEDALQTAHRASNDRAVGLAGYTLAVGLLNQDAAADRHRGLELMMQTRDIWLRKRALFLIPVTDVWAARETARRGDRDAAIEVMRQAVDELRQAGYLFYGVWGTGVLVETLLERGDQGDLAEAQEAIDWLANLRPIKIRRCSKSRCCGCGRCCPGPAATTWPTGISVSRYRAMAESLGFEGHIAMAKAMK